MHRRQFLKTAGLIAASAAAGNATPLTSGASVAGDRSTSRVPVIDVTDLYHPFQDPGDNLDLVHAYALEEVDLRAIVLDVTNAFRLPIANFPNLSPDPNGPREPGIVPVMQLNSIFDRAVACAVGPYSPMNSLTDDMRYAPAIQQAGVELILETLRRSASPVEIVSFGCCRAIAVAYNRDPQLMKSRVRRIHISAGTASRNFEMGSSPESNAIPGGEWNVALDPLAFRRLLASGLPIALYPCAGINGPFTYDAHNTYWNLPDCSFVRDLDPRLRNYVQYALGREIRPDFLKVLNHPMDEAPAKSRLDAVWHVWETAIWLNVSSQEVVERAGRWRILPAAEVEAHDRVLRARLEPCTLRVREDARIAFEPCEESNITIFVRDDPHEYQRAMREAVPALWRTFQSRADA